MISSIAYEACYLLESRYSVFPDDVTIELCESDGPRSPASGCPAAVPQPSPWQPPTPAVIPAVIDNSGTELRYDTAAALLQPMGSGWNHNSQAAQYGTGKTILLKCRLGGRTKANCDEHKYHKCVFLC